MGVSHPASAIRHQHNLTTRRPACGRGARRVLGLLLPVPDDIKNPFKTVDVDVAEWVAAKRALVKQQGYTATLLGIFRNREGQTLMVSTKTSSA